MPFSSQRGQSKSKISITKLMSLLGAFAACSFAIAIPSVYYAISINGTLHALTIEADFLAKSIEKTIQTRPDLWEFESVRLNALILQPSIQGGDHEKEIRTATGKLVIKNDFIETRPIISASATFFDSGRLAGSIVLRHSIRSQIITTALLGILSSFLGTLIYVIFRTYPIKKLDSTLADLRRAEEKERRNREEAERMAGETAVIADIGLLIGSTLDIDEVYERFAEAVRKVIPFDRIVINLIDVEMSTVINVYMAGHGVTDRIVGVRYPLEGSGNFEMVRTKSSLLIQTEDFDEYKDRFPMLLSTFQAGFRSIMNVPIFSKGEIMGGLLLRSLRPYAYTEKDVRLAERVGNQIAGAIANAQLFAELKKMEEMYRLSFENAMDVIYTIDTDLNIISISPSVERILEYKPQDLIGRPVSDLGDILTPESFEQATADTSSVLKGETIPATIYRFIAKDGTIKFGEVSVSPVMRDGKISGIISVARDITERKEAEQKLRDAHDKMALLINSISSILIAVSEDNRIVFWNTEAEKQFGIPEKEILGKPLRELGIQWDLDQIMDGIVRCRKKNNTVGLDNVRFVQRDGKEGILGIGISPSFGEISFGMVTLIQGANITRRKIMENRLIQAQKLESIGQLAAGIAHEINTPTQYVGDNVRFLQTSFEALKKVLMKYEALKERIREGKACDDLLDEVEKTVQETDVGYLTEEIPRAFQQTLEGVERVSRIVQSIKAFAHPGTAEKAPVDINKAIENTIAVARNEWKYAADLVTDFDPSLPLVSCVLGDINQVVLNVLVNAAQAVSEVVNGGSGGKGKISISTRQDDLWVEIRISDTGNGIPVEIRPRIFDPFFTTKEVGKGTGQGLTISHTAIVERHHGSITFDTKIGQGTTFIIRLPVKEPINAGN